MRPFVAPYAAERIAIPAQSQSGSVTYVGCSAESSPPRRTRSSRRARWRAGRTPPVARAAAPTPTGCGGSGVELRALRGHAPALPRHHEPVLLAALHLLVPRPRLLPGCIRVRVPGGAAHGVRVRRFWGAPMTGVDTKPGTLIHEMSHVLSGTDDWAYGQSEAHTLAVNNPALAIDNADNHEYYGEGRTRSRARGRARRARGDAASRAAEPVARRRRARIRAHVRRRRRAVGVVARRPARAHGRTRLARGGRAPRG